MGTGANAEALAESSGEAAAAGSGADRLVGIALVGFADAAQGSQAFLDAGIVHAPRV